MTTVKTRKVKDYFDEIERTNYLNKVFDVEEINDVKEHVQHLIEAIKFEEEVDESDENYSELLEIARRIEKHKKYKDVFDGVVLSYYGNHRKIKSNGYEIVSISQGLPRGGGIKKQLLYFAPERSMIRENNKKVFQKSYFRKLNELGVERAIEIIETAKMNYGKIALCCFESLKKDHEWCHRSLLGDWLFENTSVKIKEL